MKRVCLILVCLIVTGVGTEAWSAGRDASLMFVGDFERGGLEPYGDKQWEHTVRKLEMVTSPVRHGERALKITLDRDQHKDMKGNRTDVWIDGMSRKFQMGGEYWYGFSTRFPASWAPDTQSELFAQWVGWRKGGPSLAIYVYGDEYCLKKRWGAGAKDYERLWVGKITPDRGKWTDWVFHVKWSAGADGFVEAWKDGEKVVSHRGRTCAPGKFGPYFKFGVYKWPWKKPPSETPSTRTRRTLYIDEIRIGDKTATYEKVAPPGK